MSTGPFLGWCSALSAWWLCRKSLLPMLQALLQHRGHLSNNVRHVSYLLLEGFKECIVYMEYAFYWGLLTKTSWSFISSNLAL
jgi:hypothetical protein